MEESKEKELHVEIETPNREIDVPLNDFGEKNSPVKVNEQKDWQKWIRNMGFMKLIIAMMFLMYVIDLFVTKGVSNLQEPLFEVLKVILFSVSGFVFAKNNND